MDLKTYDLYEYEGLHKHLTFTIQRKDHVMHVMLKKHTSIVKESEKIRQYHRLKYAIMKETASI